MARYVKQCAWCGREFTATRSDARYCSSTCRKRHERRGSTHAFIRPPVAKYEYEGRPPGEGEVVDAVMELRRAVCTLSAASVTGPVDYRPLCGRLSHAVAGVLEVEGL